MHDFKTSYRKVFNTIKSVAKEYFVFGLNYRFYPNALAMSG